VQVCLITQFRIGHSADYENLFIHHTMVAYSQCVAISRVVKCEKGVVTWFPVSQSHAFRASIPHFTSCIPHPMPTGVFMLYSFHIYAFYQYPSRPQNKANYTNLFCWTTCESAITNYL